MLLPLPLFASAAVSVAVVVAVASLRVAITADPFYSLSHGALPPTPPPLLPPSPLRSTLRYADSYDGSGTASGRFTEKNPVTATPATVENVAEGLDKTNQSHF